MSEVWIAKHASMLLDVVCMTLPFCLISPAIQVSIIHSFPCCTIQYSTVRTKAKQPPNPAGQVLFKSSLSLSLPLASPVLSCGSSPSQPGITYFILCARVPCVSATEAFPPDERGRSSPPAHHLDTNLPPIVSVLFHV